MIFKNAPQKFKDTIFRIAIGAYLYGVSIGINYIIIPLFLNNHGLSKARISTVFDAEISAIFVIAPFLPRLISKFGMAKIFITSLILRSILLTIFPFFSSYICWLVIYFCYGLGAITALISFQIWINNICTDKVRGTSIGLLTAAIATGIATGPKLIDLIGSSGNFPFMISALICLSSLIPLLSIKKEFPIITSHSNLKYREIFKQSKLPILAGIIAEITMLALFGFITLFALDHGVHLDTAKMFISSMLVGSILLDIPIGMILDRVNKKAMLVVCGLLMAICSLSLPFYITNFVKSSIILVIWFAAMGGIMNCSISLLGERFKNKDLVKANSLFTILSYSAGIIAMLVCGKSMDLYGPNGLTVSLAIFYCAYLLLIGYIIKKEK